MYDQVIKWTKSSAGTLERALAWAILVGVVAFATMSGAVLSSMDWRATETFYELIYRVLLLVIGIELARTLLTHDLEAILELLAFVVARKTLKPDVTALDILLSVAAFCALMGARAYFVPRPARTAEQDHSTH